MDNVEAIVEKLSRRFGDTKPSKVCFYCSRLMKCAEEQYRGIFQVLQGLKLPGVAFSYTYNFPSHIKTWDTDKDTLYVLAMNVRELARMLQQSNQKLPKFYVWWQTEQYSNTRFFKNANWMRALCNAMWLWEYSEANEEYLKTRVGDAVVTLVRHAFYAPTILHAPVPEDLLDGIPCPLRSSSIGTDTTSKVELELEHATPASNLPNDENNKPQEPLLETSSQHLTSLNTRPEVEKKDCIGVPEPLTEQPDAESVCLVEIESPLVGDKNLSLEPGSSILDNSLLLKFLSQGTSNPMGSSFSDGSSVLKTSTAQSMGSSNHNHVAKGVTSPPAQRVKVHPSGATGVPSTPVSAPVSGEIEPVKVPASAPVSTEPVKISPPPSPAITGRALALKQRREAMVKRRLALQQRTQLQQRVAQRNGAPKAQPNRRVAAPPQMQRGGHRIPQSSVNAALKPNVDSYDILLLGALAGPSRTKIVNLLRNTYKLSVASPPRGRYWYAEEREKQIRKAKVCINVHYFRDPSVLETARLNLLLANGSAIVSEKSTAGNGIMDKRYEDAGAVIFVRQDDLNGLAKICNDLVKDDVKRKEQQKKATAFAWSKEQSLETHAKTVVDVFKALYKP